MATSIIKLPDQIVTYRRYDTSLCGKLLTSSNDLDTIIETGFYTWDSSSTPTNAPQLTGSAFLMLEIVASSVAWIQIVYGIRGSSPYNGRAIRSRWGGTISPWVIT